MLTIISCPECGCIYANIVTTTKHLHGNNETTVRHQCLCESCECEFTVFETVDHEYHVNVHGNKYSEPPTCNACGKLLNEVIEDISTFYVWDKIEKKYKIAETHNADLRTNTCGDCDEEITDQFPIGVENYRNEEKE
jgi:hypothetical protein